jgi:hypothetical protein
VPDGVDWDVHRVLTSGKYPGASLAEIRDMWTIDDLLDAHDVIDALEAAEADAVIEARRGAERKR